MKYPILLFLVFATKIAFSGDRPVEINSIDTSLHTQIHDGVGFCLVCYTNVSVISAPNKWDRLEITATIVDVVKGDHKIGDRIKFLRKVEGKAADVSGMKGGLRFLRFDKEDLGGGGKVYISFQDPAATWSVSKRSLEFAKEHKKSGRNAEVSENAEVKDYTEVFK